MLPLRYREKNELVGAGAWNPRILESDSGKTIANFFFGFQ